MKSVINISVSGLYTFLSSWTDPPLIVWVTTAIYPPATPSTTWYAGLSRAAFYRDAAVSSHRQVRGCEYRSGNRSFHAHQHSRFYATFDTRRSSYPGPWTVLQRRRVFSPFFAYNSLWDMPSSRARGIYIPRIIISKNLDLTSTSLKSNLMTLHNRTPRAS